MTPTEAELWEEAERELARQEMAAKLGGEASMDNRRTPRVRLRKGRTGQFIILGSRMTKRAAFRAARELRDAHGEKRPQVVWQVAKHQWNFGCRRDSVPSDGGSQS